jgi:two-component system, chemotaxis family, response regulator WspF
MRIAIVNDVKITVEVLKRIIGSAEEHEIIWVAYDGLEAVKKSAKDLPDLILMDLVMPMMNGVEATAAIMKNTPCAILIVTSSVNNNLSMVFKAMGSGALDVVSTPVLDLNSPDLGGLELLNKIDRIACLIGKNVNKIKAKQTLLESPKKESLYKAPPLLLIGSSTGGPIALTKILSHFHESPDFTTIIVQHVDEQFASSLARWLSNEVSQNIQIAYDGISLKKGMVLLAGKNDHLIMTEAKTLQYTKYPVDNPYRPSVDVLYNSVAQNWPDKSIAVLLTGMGSDGAKGMKTLNMAGWHTIAEHEASCVVYGMPKAAIELGAVSSVLHLDDIGPAILSFFESKKPAKEKIKRKNEHDK